MANVFEAFINTIRSLGIDPRHLVHVGAHEGQEVPYYRDASFRRITLVEPIPHLAAGLRDRFPDTEVVECACSSDPGVATLSVMRRTNMSTLLRPARTDPVIDRIEVKVRRLDDIAPDANVAVIDAQGAELSVLRGANLDALDLAIVETCTVRDPTMAAHYGDVVDYMAAADFSPRGHWSRDYGYVHRWARGRRSRVEGEIRDVIFVRN